MCEVLSTGLTRLEECRLRFELAIPDDPFIDAPVNLELSLNETITTLQRVQDALASPVAAPTGTSAGPTPGPVRQHHTANSSATPSETSSKRKNVRWREVVSALCAGDLDVFTCRQNNAVAAANAKWKLTKKYPGLVVDVETTSDGAALLSVHAGTHQPTESRGAA
jgi:hypothetical protein